MVEVLVVIRESGSTAPDYSLFFELPAVPSQGSYLSIVRPGDEPYSEDVIVRDVWWRLNTPVVAAIETGEPLRGGVTEIIIECDVAEGPYSTDHWRDRVVATARRNGVDVPIIPASRFSVRQDEISK